MASKNQVPSSNRLTRSKTASLRAANLDSVPTTDIHTHHHHLAAVSTNSIPDHSTTTPPSPISSHDIINASASHTSNSSSQTDSNDKPSQIPTSGSFTFESPSSPLTSNNSPKISTDDATPYLSAAMRGLNTSTSEKLAFSNPKSFKEYFTESSTPETTSSSDLKLYPFSTCFTPNQIMDDFYDFYQSSLNPASFNFGRRPTSRTELTAPRSSSVPKPSNNSPAQQHLSKSHVVTETSTEISKSPQSSFPTMMESWADEPSHLCFLLCL
ncbi:hypothetical protein CANARDRAFT_5494 [[Candida] arabinofermentans NRRL YB-2248]|uniref:Uncharacterized protein n=1 Tax=[Candida] arabinofermentans NRRL YB-2248 TaxID=983967 RepID=A0A1E4T8U9_9ASCO|nr:hypothetical protein CANARDRAFT_5494 [[Candida] arabinofermentans NRRL YB-2248]